MQPVSIANALFTRTQQKVIGLLYGQPDEKKSFADISRRTGMGMGAVHKELTKFLSAGLVKDERFGNQRLFCANRENPIFGALQEIALKLLGVKDVILPMLDPVKDEIVEAFIFGSVAKGTDTSASDIDVMIVGNPDYMKVMEIIASAEEKLGRTVHIEVLDPVDVARMEEEKDPVWQRIFGGARIDLITRS